MAVNVSSVSSFSVVVYLTQCSYLLSIPFNFLLPVMLLTASPSFKCFEGFFLPFVTENTVSAAKNSTLLILLVDSWNLWSGPTTRWVKNWVNCSEIWTYPSTMSSNVIPLEGRAASFVPSFVNNYRYLEM